MSHRSLIAAAILAATFAGSLALPAQAKDVTAGSLKISSPWARATPKGASVGGGYMTVANTGDAPDRLVAGQTDISNRFEIHEMSLDKGIMKMRMLPKGLEIKPGETVVFKPGSYHLMFMELKRRLTQGEHFKVTLQFEKAGKVDVDFTVAGVGAKKMDPAGGHAMPGMNHSTPGMKMK